MQANKATYSAEAGAERHSERFEGLPEEQDDGRSSRYAAAAMLLFALLGLLALLVLAGGLVAQG